MRASLVKVAAGVLQGADESVYGRDHLAVLVGREQANKRRQLSGNGGEVGHGSAHSQNGISSSISSLRLFRGTMACVVAG